MQTAERLSIAAILLLLAAVSPTGIHAESATSATAPATAPAEDLLYDDPSAHSSATITQVLPNSSTSQLTLDNIRRIRVKQGVLIIEWGNTATTLLPRQFVSAITINKRAPAAAATQATPH